MQKLFSIEWNEEKNETLKVDRGISFEDITLAIDDGNLLDVIQNSSSHHQ